MRLISLVLAAFSSVGPASAHDLPEYIYPDYAVTVVFRRLLRSMTTTYQVAEVRSVPARVLTARQDKGVSR